MEITSKPLKLDEIDRRILQLEMERLSLEREREKEGGAANQKYDSLVGTLDDLRKQQAELEKAWNSEKSVMSRVQEIKEEMDKVNVDIQKAEREYDLQKAAMLKYGKITELQKMLVEAEENVTKAANSGSALLRNEVLT